MTRHQKSFQMDMKLAPTQEKVPKKGEKLKKFSLGRKVYGIMMTMMMMTMTVELV